MQFNFHLSRFRHNVLRGAVFMLVLVNGMAVASTIRVPLMAQAPAIDGTIRPKEWAAASSFDGFLTNGTLQRRRVTGYIGATATDLYIAMRSQTPDEGKLVADQKEMDAGHAVWDDSLEIYLTPNPDSPERITYQLLVNSAGVGGYCVFRGGSKQDAEVYNGGWKIANGVHNGVWDFECAIPISSLGAGAKDRRASDGEWQINLTRNWKNPWEWSSLAGGYPDGGCRFIFTPGAPAVAFTTNTDPTMGHFTGTLTLTNPGMQALPVKATLTVTRPKLADLLQEKTVTLEAGKAQTLSLTVPADAKATGCTLRLLVTSPDGQTSYYDRETNWSIAATPNRWMAKPSAPMLLQSISPSPDEAYFGAHMQRTMSLLATSNPARRRPVHILIYGQSITGCGWWLPFMKELQQRFPYADLTVENRSIGGIGTPTLLRTAIYDVYPAYPDLVIFQAYGGDNGEMEQLHRQHPPLHHRRHSALHPPRDVPPAARG